MSRWGPTSTRMVVCYDALQAARSWFFSLASIWHRAGWEPCHLTLEAEAPVRALTLKGSTTDIYTYVQWRQLSAFSVYDPLPLNKGRSGASCRLKILRNFLSMNWIALVKRRKAVKTN